ncbi:major facilitator superfamily transporter [Biscogniauxia mediterranea]|nr:major facilitator superfamily transporter [Biscogniauxia mediterranea]
MSSPEATPLSNYEESVSRSVDQLSASKRASEVSVKIESEEWTPSRHEKAILYTLAIISMVVAMDASIIVTTLGDIMTDIGGSTTEAFWIGTSYLLVNAVTMPFICSVSDVLGRPICLTFSLAAFLVGTICCATARDMAAMLTGRSIQGIGGAGIHSLGLVTQTDIVPLRWRPKWYGVTLAAWAFGLSIGPIIGGAVVQYSTWRWIFYIMFPFCAFGLVAVPYLLTLRPRAATAREKLARIDWVGGALFTSSATSFLVAISWGGSQYAWDSAQTLVPLIIGVGGLLVTVIYESNCAKHPFLRRSLYHDMTSACTYVAGCIQGLVMYGLLYYTPFYFMSVKNYSALDAGVAILASLLTVCLGGIVSGRVVSRFNNYRWPICIGWFVASIGACLFFIWPANDGAGVWVMTLLVVGSGQGIILNAQNFASQAMCRPGDEAAAAAMYAFVRQFGMALGVGVGASTFQNVMALKLQWLGLDTEIAKQAESYIGVLRTMPHDDLWRGVIDAYKYGFMGVFAVYLAVSVVALVLSLLFVKNVDMTRGLESEHRLDGDRLAKHWGDNNQV